MSQGADARYEAFARECVRQALQTGSADRKERLLERARNWIRASMNDDEAQEIRARLMASRLRAKHVKARRPAERRPAK